MTPLATLLNRKRTSDQRGLQPLMYLASLSQQTTEAYFFSMDTRRLSLTARLIDSGASLKIRLPEDESTPLAELATFAPPDLVAKAARTLNSDWINASDRQGRTPVYMAAINGQARNLQVLFDYGASPFTPNSRNQGYLMAAISAWSPETLKVIVTQMRKEILNSNDPNVAKKIEQELERRFEGLTPYEYANQLPQRTSDQVELRQELIRQLEILGAKLVSSSSDNLIAANYKNLNTRETYNP